MYQERISESSSGVGINIEQTDGPGMFKILCRVIPNEPFKVIRLRIP